MASRQRNGAGILNAGGVLGITDSVISDHTAHNLSLGAGVFNDTGGS